MASEPRMIELDELKKFCARVLIKEGLDYEHARIVADVLAETDGCGTYSHGTKNLHNYIRKFRAGGMDIHAVPKIIKEGAGFALVDGHSAIGMVPAYRAMELAVEKAGSCGVACVLVRNGSHFGAAGYYANMAAKRNMIGLAFSNVDANMTIPGAKGKVIGNNPMSYAVPAGKNPPVFLDIAMSQVASLKVIQARKEGKPVPDTWITDRDGFPTTDPSRYPEEGAMQPMAAHKGYGLALMIEILTGVLSGGGIAGEIPSWLFRMKEKNNVSHAFLVIDVSKFMDLSMFHQRMEDLADYLHKTPRSAGTERIYCPGEMEWTRYAAAADHGLKLPADAADSLNALAEEAGIPVPWK